MIFEIAGSATLAIWLYLLLGRGGFWRMRTSRPERALDGAPPSIVAVIPARNEAAVVGRAVESLARQQYAGCFHIVLVDDDSSDGTAGVAQAAATPDRLTVIRAAPLPAGWTGKLWAVSEGIRHAAAFNPEFLLLTDADIVHPPGNLEALTARSRDRDLVSYMATLECGSPAERALIPAFVYFFLMLYPPVWIGSRSHATAGAAGGCILIRRTALEGIGGIAAIRGALIDDCTLARAVKRAGGRVWLGLDAETRSIRGYATFAEIGRMISRTAFTQLHHSAVLLAGAVLGLALTYLAPPILTLVAPQPAAGLAATAWLLMSVTYFPALRFYKCPWYWAPLLPLVAAFYLWATLHSAVSYWRGAGGRWKGRIQDGAPS